LVAVAVDDRRGSERGQRHRVRPPLEERTAGGGRAEQLRTFFASPTSSSLPLCCPPSPPSSLQNAGEFRSRRGRRLAYQFGLD
jgi:hypothetical protein